MPTAFTLPTISTISNWYWINNSSQIFGSSKNAIVPSNDPGYLSFVAQGNLPTPWPKDINGNQTTAALQQSIEFYLPTYIVNLPPP